MAIKTVEHNFKIPESLEKISNESPAHRNEQKLLLMGSKQIEIKKKSFRENSPTVSVNNKGQGRSRQNR